MGISSISFRKNLRSCPRAPLSQHPARTTDPDCRGLSQTSLQCTGWGNGVARQYAVTPPIEHLHSAEIGEKMFFRLAYSLVVCADARGAQRDNAPSRANFRQIMANLIIMHPAETEEIVLQAYSLRASRVQAYRCYELLWGYRAEHGQIQEMLSLCEESCRDISSKLSWDFVYFLVQFIVPLIVLTVSGAGTV